MTKNESGRSMVEMLGVLAIIGVLSVGGIAGYTMAMRNYKANEAANAIAMLAIAIQVRNAEVTYQGIYNTTNPAGIASGADSLKSLSGTKLSAKFESEPVCNEVYNKLAGSTTLKRPATNTCSTNATLEITIS